MNTLFLTLQHRRSTKTLRLHYGLEGMKYIIQVYEGEINGHGEKEGLPIEYQYEFEHEMLKHVHDLKNDLREKGWWEKETPEISQTSFLRIENSDAELDFTDHLTPQTFADKLEFKRSGLIAGFLHTGRRIIGITILLLVAERIAV